MLSRRPCSFALLFAVLGASSASAHFLWLVVDQRDGAHGTLNLYFEGGPAPGDGQYLDPFIERGTTWIRTPGKPASTALKLTEATGKNRRWLKAALPAEKNRVIDSYCQWGVYRYGKKDVLLHYYSKVVNADSPAAIQALAKSDKLRFDIVPTVTDDGLSCQVIWQGQPAAGRPLAVRGPKGFRAKPVTDEAGVAKFATAEAGRYTVHVSLDEPDQSGTFQEKAYHLKRHHATLLVELPLAE